MAMKFLTDANLEETMKELHIGGGVYATPQQYGAKGDGVTDDTAAINECLANNSLVYIPNGTYLIDAAIGVKPQSNQVIQLDANATLKGNFSNASNGGTVVAFDSAENVVICGGNIVGDKAEYPDDKTMEFMFGVSIKNSKNVVVDSCRVHDFRGDGFAIPTSGREADYEESHNVNIKITNCEIYNCSRHGMFVDGIDGFLAEDVKIHDCNTFSYSCAIDFEMHYEHNKMHNIKLERLTSYNTNLGIQCSQITDGAYKNFELNNCELDRFHHDFDADIEIHNNRIALIYHSRKGKFSAHNCYIEQIGFSENSGLAYFYKCHFENDSEGILKFNYTNGSESEADVTFEQCTFVTYTFADGETPYGPNALMSAMAHPKATSFDGCTFYINNPNGTGFSGATKKFRMNNCYMNVSFDYDGEANDIMFVGVDAIVTNNVIDTTNAKWSGSSKFGIYASAYTEKMVLIGNVFIKGTNAKYVFPIYNKTAGSSLLCINNVCRDYWLETVNAGIDTENVTFTNIGMITADTTA